jgi:uncharacterized membrane protein YobD (UPF0266 family)
LKDIIYKRKGEAAFSSFTWIEVVVKPHSFTYAGVYIITVLYNFKIYVCYIDIKNNFFKNKKYYFNIFFNKKYFKKQSLIHPKIPYS